MTSLRFFDRRLGSLGSALTLLLALAAPGLIPAFASAAQLTERSIALSNSSKAATNVDYNVSFTTTGDAGAIVIDFCSNSPLHGTACTAPTDFDATSVSSGDSGVTATDISANRVKIVDSNTTGVGAYDVELNGIENPSVSGTMYARITTFTDGTDADAYTDVTSVPAHLDDGGAAVSITDTIGVTAAVLESMTFCVASADITPNCANASSNLPNLNIGETSGSVTALSSTALSTRDLWTQISTNAAGGAVINLKSNATDCGGLLRAGSSACNIVPAGVNSITLAAGTAAFGVKTAASSASATGATNPNGDIDPVGSYNASSYYMGFVSGNGTGVTSTYGDPFLDTNDTVVNNTNMQLTFGASIANNTPAGSYSANLSMIATGKF